jgi:hypothetical protein
MACTLATMPRRTVVLAAKAAVLTALVLSAGTAASLLAGRLIRGDEGPVLRPAVGSVLYLVLIGLLALGAATAVRDSAAAVGLVLGLLYVFPILANVVNDAHWQRAAWCSGCGTHEQAAVSAAGDRRPDRRRAGRDDLGSQVLRQDDLGGAR